LWTLLNGRVGCARPAGKGCAQQRAQVARPAVVATAGGRGPGLLVMAGTAVPPGHATLQHCHSRGAGPLGHGRHSSLSRSCSVANTAVETDHLVMAGTAPDVGCSCGAALLLRRACIHACMHACMHACFAVASRLHAGCMLALPLRRACRRRVCAASHCLSHCHWITQFPPQTMRCRPWVDPPAPCKCMAGAWECTAGALRVHGRRMAMHGWCVAVHGWRMGVHVWRMAVHVWRMVVPRHMGCGMRQHAGGVLPAVLPAVQPAVLSAVPHARCIATLCCTRHAERTPAAAPAARPAARRRRRQAWCAHRPTPAATSAHARGGGRGPTL